MFVRPGGTIETVPRNTAFVRPYGTQDILAVHVPSSELLGYYQTSLRDEQLATACFTSAIATIGK
jgi:hypothetical protein